MIALSRLVVVAHEALAFATAIEAILIPMRPVRRRPGQRPDHAFDDCPIRKNLPELMDLARLHYGLIYHNMDRITITVKPLAQKQKTSRGFCFVSRQVHVSALIACRQSSIKAPTQGSTPTSSRALKPISTCTSPPARIGVFSVASSKYMSLITRR